MILYPKDLQPGDQILSLEYGYLTVERVYPSDPRYPLSQLVDTNRGRRDLTATRILQGVVRKEVLDMKAQHTPGPWNADGRAVVGPSSEQEICICTSDDDVCEAEARANAILVAAAPDLLEALEGTMKALSRMIDKYNPDSIEAEWIGTANDAIMKARGGRL
jgi:hypothetical protein